MKNSTLTTGILSLFFVSVFFSCDQQDVGALAEDQGAPVFSQDKPSLEEFMASVDSDEEKFFFESTPITDHRSIVTDAINDGVELMQKPRITFKWHGKGGTGGCSKPLGVCLVIPIGKLHANADLMIYNDTYILLFKEGQTDNGLTRDGYLPIMKDVYVDENITIAAGIYKANFNEERREYSAVGITIL